MTPKVESDDIRHYSCVNAIRAKDSDPAARSHLVLLRARRECGLIPPRRPRAARSACLRTEPPAELRRATSCLVLASSRSTPTRTLDW